MHGQHGNAGVFGQMRDAQRIFIVAIPAGTDFQCDGHRVGPDAHRADHRLDNALHQRLVLQKRRAGRDIADLLGRTAHVDVNDLRTVRDVVARGLGHHERIGAGDLHGDRLDLAGMVGAAHGLFAFPQLRVRGDHFRHRIARAQPFAQLPERPVGHARHGSDEQVITQIVGAESGHSVDARRGRLGNFCQSERSRNARENHHFSVNR
ncbi:hypothetical protein GGD41_001090 [Paraburkholderia bryophila]|uniref:Uncharacterized protein n=1 Tax=Paraburkholderia bryophila TaxID=420952 RepID=A0A7Y9W4N0_9BURK|nr:hypothetical protein [Paraburkholderia bryophila]